MAKGEQPTQVATPDPRTRDITDNVASDLMKDRASTRSGRKSSFLTAGMRELGNDTELDKTSKTTKTPTQSILGSFNNTLG